MRNIKVGIAIVFFFISTVKIYSQQNVDYNNNNNKFSVATPDVSNFEKYSLNAVNYYTGKPIITVPIYTIKTGDIVYPVNLGYDAGGIKVDQLASDVGLGWNLTSTILTRTIHGDNDFDNTGSIILDPNYNSYSAADKSAHFGATQDDGDGKIGYFLQKVLNATIQDGHKRVDFLPDVYHFYTNGFTTSFFFNDENTPIEINPQGTRIIATKSNQTFYTGRKKFGVLELVPSTQDFFSITIITSQGIKYTFNDVDVAMNQDIYVNNNIGGDYTHVHPAPQISAWHITKIDDLKSNKKIEFLYETTSSNPNGGISPTSIIESIAQRSYEFISNPWYTNNQPAEPCEYPVNAEYWINNGYLLNNTARIDIRYKKLRTILFDEGKLSFTYSGDNLNNNQSGGPRFDVYGREYLSGINLFDKSQLLIKSFTLAYDYFVSDYSIGEFNPDNSFNPYRYKRLKLTEVIEEGKPAYKFYYNESKKLPPINSFAVDFLGYSNNSPDATSTTVLANQNLKPTMYYYPNQFEKSLVPFPINNLTGLTIPGFFDRKANNDIQYAAAWSLNKIINPLGGSTEYVYESNEFEEFGQNIKGGGLRIAKQILNDGIGVAKTLNYSYLMEGSTLSSGKLSSFPYFGHPVTKLFPVELDWQAEPIVFYTPPPATVPTEIELWKIYGKSNLNADITSGSYVGYARVVETEIGNGKNEFNFTSNQASAYQNVINRLHPYLVPLFANDGLEMGALRFCFSDFIIANSGLGANIFTDNSFMRGKLISERIFSESGQLLQSKQTNYNYNLVSTYTFNNQITRIRGLGGDQDNFVTMVVAQKDFKVAQFLPISVTNKYFDTNGNFVTDIKSFTFNSIGDIKTIQSSNSNGDSTKTEFYYPTDVTASLSSLPGLQMSNSDNAIYRYMVLHDNIKSKKIQIDDYINSNLITSKRETFEIFNPTVTVNNTISTETLKVAKGNGLLEDVVKYNSYDDDYNVTQYTARNGVPVSFIWGYNGTKLIARIENLPFTNISSIIISNIKSLSNLDFDNCRLASCKEQLLRDGLTALRTSLATTYPNALVTTYTYDPLVGITSVTDSKFETQYYTYDSLQRLVKVEDKDGKILNETQYHYKN